MTYTPIEDLRALAARIALVLPTGSWARQEVLYLSTGPHSAWKITAGLVAVRTYLGKLDRTKDVVLAALNATRMLPRS